MIMSNETIQKPNYMKKFKCIGADCEDSCCAGWRVNFDKKTTQTYLSAADEEIRKIASNNIKKVKVNRSSANYSFIQMNEKGACPFQQTDKLCMIHNRMGEKALSKTCSTYPRHQGILEQGIVEVATLSCPEAARLCLLEIDSMHIAEHNNNLSFHQSQREHYDKKSAAVYLHSSTLNLLENKQIKPEEIILIYSTTLSMLIKGADTAFAQENRFVEFSTIVQMVKQSLTEIRSSDLQHDVGIKFQIAKVMPLLVKRTREQLSSNKRFSSCSIQCLEGFAITEGDNRKSVRLYAQALKSLTASEKATVSLGFRNYLVNEFIKNSRVYRSGGEKAFKALQNATVRLCIINFLILGVKASDQDAVIEDVLVECVSSSSRAFEHSTILLDQISEMLDSIESQSPAMLGLIAPKL